MAVEGRVIRPIQPTVTYVLLGLTIFTFLIQYITEWTYGVDLAAMFGMKINTSIEGGQDLAPDHSAFGPSLGMLQFQHYWLRDVHAGGNPDLWAYSPTAACARANRFVCGERLDPALPEGPVYAFQFDASLVARYLRRYAEQRGFEAVWQAESRLVRDAIVPMAAYAAVTSRMKVGSGVINNWTRNIGLLAATFLTLDELAPNRILCGIGAWWDPLASNVGVNRRKPTTAMRETVDVLRRLLRMERVTRLSLLNFTLNS